MPGRVGYWEVHRQHYYRWLNKPITDMEVVQAYRANALFDAHRDDPEFGYRLVADEARACGEAKSDRTARKLASAHRWWSLFNKKRGRNGKLGPTVHDDRCARVDSRGVVRHEFDAQAPNELWLTDITEHPTMEGTLSMCAVEDVVSNRIVAYSIGSRMKARLAVDALTNAVTMRSDVAGCIVHSDRGSRFRSAKYRKALTSHRLVGSMGRLASCKRTSSTGAHGPPETNSAQRSSPGSRPPTTGAADKPASAA